MIVRSLHVELTSVVLINGLIALEAFRVKFGHKLANGTYQLEPQWQTALSKQSWEFVSWKPLATMLASFSGSLPTVYWWIDGVVSTRIAQTDEDRRVVQVALVICTGFITILFCAKSQGMLLAGEILLGFPLGMINTTARESLPALAHSSFICDRSGSIGTQTLRSHVSTLLCRSRQLCQPGNCLWPDPGFGNPPRFGEQYF